MNNWKMDVYWRLPVHAQETALSLYARYLENAYYGKEYEKWKDWLKGWKSWSRSYVREWRREQLEKIMRVAGERVPFYREKWKDLDWRKINSEEDLVSLPLLDRHSIRQNEGQFVAEGLKVKSLWAEKTSGTTGTSLTVYWSRTFVQQWWAIMEVMVRNIAGVAQEMPRAMMGGRPIIPGNSIKPPYWRFNGYWKQLYLSSYHVSQRTTPEYIEALRKYRSRWITGYGSSIAALAEYALVGMTEPVRLEAAIVSGDTLLPGMRRSIEAFFRCRCFDHYGQSEGVAMAMECSHGRLHINPVLGVMEILQIDGTPARPGDVGEIVVTTLLNDAMPLVRYRTGDYAAWGEEDSCPCGNFNPVITNLEGRTDDYLVTSDGRKVGRLSTAIKRSPSIHSAQLVQDKPGHAYFLVCPGEGYQRAHAGAVMGDITERLGEFSMELIEVCEIPKTARGKISLVVRLDEHPRMRSLYEAILR